MENKKKLEHAPPKGGKRRRKEPPAPVDMMALMSSVPSPVWDLIMAKLDVDTVTEFRQACHLFNKLVWQYEPGIPNFMVKPYYAHFNSTPLWPWRSTVETLSIVLDYFEDFLPLQEFWCQLPKLNLLCIAIQDPQFTSRLFVQFHTLYFLTSLQRIELNGAAAAVPSLPLRLPRGVRRLLLADDWPSVFSDYHRNPQVTKMEIYGRHPLHLSSISTIASLNINVHYPLQSLPVNLRRMKITQHTTELIPLAGLLHLTSLRSNNTLGAPISYLPTSLQRLSLIRPQIFTNIRHLALLTHLELTWSRPWAGVIQLPSALRSLVLEGPECGPTSFKLVSTLEFIQLDGAVLPRKLPSKWVLPHLTSLALPLVPVLRAAMVLMHLSRLPSLTQLCNEDGTWIYPKETQILNL